MQLYQNPTILSESSVSVKLLLWAQDYCPIPKWQTQNTVRVIRVIAKPTTWKTSTVLVPGTQPITDQKLRRKCSIKVQPQWKEYKYKCWSEYPFTPFFTCFRLTFPCFPIYFWLKPLWVSVQHVHMHIHAFLWCLIFRSVLTPTFKICPYTEAHICISTVHGDMHMVFLLNRKRKHFLCNIQYVVYESLTVFVNY